MKTFLGLGFPLILVNYWYTQVADEFLSCKFFVSRPNIKFGLLTFGTWMNQLEGSKQFTWALCFTGPIREGSFFLHHRNLKYTTTFSKTFQIPQNTLINSFSLPFVFPVPFLSLKRLIVGRCYNPPRRELRINPPVFLPVKWN